MSLHTQLIRGLLALPAALLIAIAGLMSSQASALPCVVDRGGALPRVDVVAGKACVVVRDVATTGETARFGDRARFMHC